MREHRPWEEAGISYATYRWRIKNGKDPLGKKERPGRSLARFSGRKYVNPPEKIAAIKEKYKNGVTREILEEILR